MHAHRLTAQARSLRLLILGIFVFVGMILAAVMLIHMVKGMPVGDMLRDPVSVAGLSFYTGFVSQLGVLMWAGAATVCLFAALLLTGNPDKRHERNFLAGFALLTAALGIDDIFLVHEVILPHFGLSEVAVYAFYAVLVVYLFVNFYRAILRTDFLLLGMAFGFFGLSMVLDTGAITGIDPHLFEETAKLAGITCWLVYFVRTAWAAVAPIPREVEETGLGRSGANGELGRYVAQRQRHD